MKLTGVSTSRNSSDSQKRAITRPNASENFHQYLLGYLSSAGATRPSTSKTAPTPGSPAARVIRRRNSRISARTTSTPPREMQKDRWGFLGLFAILDVVPAFRRTSG